MRQLERKNIMETIKIKKLNDIAIIPTKGSEFSAGYDLYSCDKVMINPHETIKIGTGLSMELPRGYFGAIFARSGLATKNGLRPSNCVGICDEDYLGEYIVALYNDSDKTQVVNIGDRIAQLIILPYQQINFIEGCELSKTTRGCGGFGHTGI
jgi:dUTP pyrophosphatase